MNLWGKRKGLLFLSALFIFFAACKDDLDKIGDFDSQGKFQVFYKEFTVPSTTVLFDSLRTDQTGRYLIGKYEDPIFGVVESTPYMAFRTTEGIANINTVYEGEGTDVDTIDVILDSVVFQTKLDRYHYGIDGETDDEFNVSIHKINETIIGDWYNFNETTYDYSTSPLGSFTVSYNTAKLDSLSSSADSVFVFSTKLDDSYLVDLKQAIQNATRPDKDGYDSTRADEVNQYIHGFALKSEANAKDVLGLRVGSTALLMYYHLENEPDEVKFFPWSFDQLDNFNSIKVDRSGSTLDGIQQDAPNEFDGYRYLQAGTGVMISLELQAVLAELGQEDNLIVNSAELRFEDVIDGGIYTNPSGFSFININDNFDRSPVNINGNKVGLLYNDNREAYTFTFDSDSSYYRGLPRMYLQDLYDNNVTNTNLMVIPSASGYSLERFSINGDNIKLRVYYSLPN